MKILVIQTAFPGDAILTLPLLQELKSQNDSMIIDILCIPSTKIIFETSDAVSTTYVYDKRNSDKGIIPFIKLAKKLRANKYDKIISPHRSARSSLLTKLIGAKESISFSTSSLKLLYTTLVEYKSEWHEVKRNLSLLGKSYDNDSWKILPKIELSVEVKNYVDALTKEIDLSKAIIIAPGSVWETKKYPSDYYKEIACSLVRAGYNIILIGGKEDNFLADSIKESSEHIFNFCGEFNFLHSIYLISKSRLIICNDSAPTHLAMCADTPVLTIYCSTVPEFGFYPYNKSGYYISYDDLECKPCGIHGYIVCPEKHFKCAYDLKTNIVLDKVFEILNERYSLHN